MFGVGGVFLAGDVAHVHSPAAGQGMNTGIADAYDLSTRLAAVLTGPAEESVLDGYERFLRGKRGRGGSSAPTVPFAVPSKVVYLQANRRKGQ